MLNNATGFERIYIACGYRDLRQGIDGLTAVIRKKKQKDKEDLSRLPKRIEKHELTKEQLKEIFGENGW